MAPAEAGIKDQSQQHMRPSGVQPDAPPAARFSKSSMLYGKGLRPDHSHSIRRTTQQSHTISRSTPFLSLTQLRSLETGLFCVCAEIVCNCEQLHTRIGLCSLRVHQDAGKYRIDACPTWTAWRYIDAKSQAGSSTYRNARHDE